MVYNTITAYIGFKKTARERIDAIDALIDAMILRMADAVDGTAANVDEYEMNDGQMKVRTRYRSVEDIEKGIKSLERIKNHYINKFNGHVTVLRDVRGLH